MALPGRARNDSGNFFSQKLARLEKSSNPFTILPSRLLKNPRMPRCEGFSPGRQARRGSIVPSAYATEEQRRGRRKEPQPSGPHHLGRPSVVAQSSNITVVYSPPSLLTGPANLIAARRVGVFQQPASASRKRCGPIARRTTCSADKSSRIEAESWRCRRQTRNPIQSSVWFRPAR